MINKAHQALGILHRVMGNSALGVRMALKIQNQAGAIIKCHMNSGIEISCNGELWLIKKIAPASKLFIDVGANIGTWSAAFLRHMPDEGRGLLFEPSPIAIEKLKQKLAAEIDRERIMVIEAAVADKIGRIAFFMESSAGETSSLVQPHSRQDAEKIDVLCTQLDHEIQQRKLPYVDFLKIDAEGYDLHVIKGAEDSIRLGKIGIIQFEYNNPWRYSGSTLAEALSFLGDNNYRVYLLKRGGLYSFNYERYGEFYGYANFVAILDECFPNLANCVRNGC